MEDKDVLSHAAQIIEQNSIGVLTTVDGQHRPRSRYMAAVAADGLLRVYSLSATETRKIEQIQQNPAVCWIFAGSNYRETVNLSGTARTAPTSSVPMSIWNQLIESTERYAAAAARDEGHFAYSVIVTQVSTLEFISPSSGIYVPHVIDLNTHAHET